MQPSTPPPHRYALFVRNVRPLLGFSSRVHSPPPYPSRVPTVGRGTSVLCECLVRCPREGLSRHSFASLAACKSRLAEIVDHRVSPTLLEVPTRQVNCVFAPPLSSSVVVTYCTRSMVSVVSIVAPILFQPSAIQTHCGARTYRTWGKVGGSLFCGFGFAH